MTSGHDVSEYLGTLGLVNHIFSSFLKTKRGKKNILVLQRPQRMRRFTCLQDCLLTLTWYSVSDVLEITKRTTLLQVRYMSLMWGFQKHGILGTTSHTHTHTHRTKVELSDVRRHLHSSGSHPPHTHFEKTHAPGHSFMSGSMYGICVGEEGPHNVVPQDGIVFTLTRVTVTLKENVFPDFFDSEQGLS